MEQGRYDIDSEASHPPSPIPSEPDMEASIADPEDEEFEEPRMNLAVGICLLVVTIGASVMLIPASTVLKNLQYVGDSFDS